MDKLTPQLNEAQLKQNIDALKRAGKQTTEIQAYVDNYKRDDLGNFILKNAPSEKSSSVYGKISNTMGDFSEGVVQGIGSTIKGVGTLVQKGLDATVNKGLPQDQRVGSDLYRPETELGKKADEVLKPTNTAMEVGKGLEQIAEYAIPGSAVTKATKGLGFVGKTGLRALTSGGVATAQSGDVGSESAIAAGTEVALPVAGKILKPAVNLTKRLVKSLASGLSGVSSDAIEAIVDNPQTAKEIAKKIDAEGQREILTKNAETIIGGISQIKKDTRAAYRQAISELKAEDIEPKKFRDSVQAVLDRYGVSSKNGERTLSNVEFSDEVNIKKASRIIDKLSKTELDGLSLRNLSDEIDNAKYKTATTDERLSFNAFISDLSKGVKSAINESTPKLSEANKAYSTNLQLAEAVEGILGKVKFKSLDEVRRVSEKLETLFSKKGISPDIVDDFLTKIGVQPGEFRANEATRQITDVGFRTNTEGLTISEIIRGVTSAVLTPKVVRDASILTGMSADVLSPILEKLAPSARATLIELLVNSQNQ